MLTNERAFQELVFRMRERAGKGTVRIEKEEGKAKNSRQREKPKKRGPCVMKLCAAVSFHLCGERPWKIRCFCFNAELVPTVARPWL